MVGNLQRVVSCCYCNEWFMSAATVVVVCKLCGKTCPVYKCDIREVVSLRRKNNWRDAKKLMTVLNHARRLERENEQ